MFTNPPKRTLTEILPFIYIIGGAVAFVFSFLLTIDKIKLLQNPTYTPPCNLNPFISCGTVMATPQASALGFPNSLLGLAGFAVLITIGVVLLTGAKLPRWFWQGIQAGTTLATAFILWLFFESVYEINALCLYCMAVWAMTLPIFWYTTIYNLHEGNLGNNPNKGPTFIERHHAILLFLIYLAIALAIAFHFWIYPYWVLHG